MAESPEIKQSGRLLRITSALGVDTLVLRRLVATEAIGQPFRIEAEVLSALADLLPRDLLGTSITCTVAMPDQPERHFHGMVRGFARTGGEARGLMTYRLEAVPRLWNLTRTADCRIFQDQSTQDILGTLFQEGGVAPVRFGTLPGAPRPYCVQFHETDFAFASRLLDEIGGGYFFEHTNAAHTLAVTGENADFPLVPGEPVVVRAERQSADAVLGWRLSSSLQPGTHVAHDFDMLRPQALLRATTPTRLATTPDPAEWEVFHWAAGQAMQPDARPAERAMEQDEALADTAEGETQVAALFAGGRLRVQEGLDGSVAPWLLTMVRHEAVDGTQLAGDGIATYDNRFIAIPAGRTWRNPAPRPRPAMPALQSALVTGPDGEEQHCDRYGRVKVHFLWDRAGGRGQNSSCYVRVSQPWAGKWGGAWFLPRIGDEVLVGFLDGDLDRAVVLGSLHNDDAMPPWALPTHVTRTGIRSRSIKGGARGTANIMGFDDKKGEEQLYLQAEKDMVVLVKNLLSSKVQGNEVREVTGESADLSDGKRTTTIKGDETLKVTQGHRATTIGMGNDALEVSRGNRETTVKMGNDTLTVSMGNMTIEVSLGNIAIKAAVGKVTIEGMQGVVLKGGPMSSVEVMPEGVTISGLKITTDAKLLHENKGTIKQHTGQGMAKFGGAITMIGG